MIAALVLVFVFAALMFLVLAFDNHRQTKSGGHMTRLAWERLQRRRDRCVTVALALFSVAAVLVLAAVIF